MTLQLGQHRKSKFRGNFEREKKLASLMCWAQLLWQQRLTGALNIAHVFGERHANHGVFIPMMFRPASISMRAFASVLNGPAAESATIKVSTQNNPASIFLARNSALGRR